MNLNFVMAVPAKGWTQACAFCGVAISDGQENVEVESKWDTLDGSSFLFRRVWHQHCHTQYWDEGEET
ncbi:hypothetical protein NSND_61650 [Nitrospira sp. ND1]|nr:hypothetical protein NSND_61650 [Nitrospira sp. ND1]